MFGDNPSVLADHDAIGVGVDFDWTPDCPGRYRVLVVVEAHQAGLRYRRLYRVEAIESACIGNELRPLRLKHIPDSLVSQLRMAMHLGVGDAFVEQPGVHLIVGLEPQTGVKNRSRTSPTWFSTCPFSHPDAGVQATGSTR